MDISSEKALWQFFVGGDLNAFSTLFKHFYPQLHNYGLRISNNQEIAEDCLQDFFIYLYEHRASLHHVRQIRSYLFVSYRRALIKKLQKQNLIQSLDEAKDAFIFSQEEIMLGEELSEQRSKILETTLNGLSPREREVIYLKYYSDLKTPEIKEVMNISYQSVLNTLQKAFSKLRNRLETAAIREVLKK